MDLIAPLVARLVVIEEQLANQTQQEAPIREETLIREVTPEETPIDTPPPPIDDGATE